MTFEVLLNMNIEADADADAAAEKQLRETFPEFDLFQLELFDGDKHLRTIPAVEGA